MKTGRRWRSASWFAIALTVVGCVLFVRLGFWQLARAREAQTLLDAFAGAATAPVEDFGALAAAPPANRFPHVRARGRFLAGRAYLRDEQMHREQPGVEAYAPFAVAGGGEVLLVDRGWLAWPHAPGTQPSVPPPPDGDVALTGIYAPFPGNGLRVGGDALSKQSTWPKLTLAIDRAEIATDLKQPLLPRVLLLDTEPASGFERVWTPNLMPPARHQAYAFQWFAFALAAGVIFIMLHWKKVDK